MTPEAQRIAIAEATFFKRVSETSWTDTRDSIDCCLHGNGPGEYPLPDYLNDLNAMHEAEKVLFHGEKWDEYCDRLDARLGSGDRIHATAAERAEELLKTMELWKE